MRRDACALGDLAVSVFGSRLAQGERPSIRAAIAWGIVLGAIQAAPERVAFLGHSALS
jgi:hypothetical protein